MLCLFFLGIRFTHSSCHRTSCGRGIGGAFNSFETTKMWSFATAEGKPALDLTAKAIAALQPSESLGETFRTVCKSVGIAPHPTFAAGFGTSVPA